MNVRGELPCAVCFSAPCGCSPLEVERERVKVHRVESIYQQTLKGLATMGYGAVPAKYRVVESEAST